MDGRQRVQPLQTPRAESGRNITSYQLKGTENATTDSGDVKKKRIFSMEGGMIFMTGRWQVQKETIP